MDRTIRRRALPVACTLLLLPSAGVWAGPPRFGRRAEDPAARYRVHVKGKPWRGARYATVTIAVWIDLQCPWCKRAMPWLDQVLRKYPRDVKLVWLDHPLSFHKAAMPAAVAGAEVFIQRGNPGFWRYVHSVFAHQDELRRGPSRVEAVILQAARAAGASVRLVRGAVTHLAHQAAIRRGMVRAQEISVIGTPTVIINGRKYRGRRTLAAISPVINAEIRKAKAAIRAGHATRRTYYASIQRRAARSTVYTTRLGPAPRYTRLDPKAVYRVPLTGKSPWSGARAPLVAVVMYMDFQCPYCKWAACVVHQLRKHYRRDVRFVFRNHPLSFHPRALPAAEAALEAYAQKGNRGFWALHDRLFPVDRCAVPLPNIRLWQRTLPHLNSRLDAAAIRRAAKAVGLNMRRFDRAMRSGAHRARIRGDQAYAVKLGARGTPAFFVNGRYVRGIRPYAQLKQIIDEELRKARALQRARHLPRRKVYRAIIARGATAPVYLP